MFPIKWTSYIKSVTEWVLSLRNERIIIFIHLFIFLLTYETIVYNVCIYFIYISTITEGTVLAIADNTGFCLACMFPTSIPFDKIWISLVKYSPTVVNYLSVTLVSIIPLRTSGNIPIFHTSFYEYAKYAYWYRYQRLRYHQDMWQTFSFYLLHQVFLYF